MQGEELEKRIRELLHVPDVQALKRVLHTAERYEKAVNSMLNKEEATDKPRQSKATKQLPEPRPEKSIEELLISYFATLQGRGVTIRELMRYGPHQIRQLRSEQVQFVIRPLVLSGLLKPIQTGRKTTYHLA